MTYWLAFLSALTIIVTGYAAVITFIQMEDVTVKRSDYPRVFALAGGMSLGVVLALTTLASMFIH